MEIIKLGILYFLFSHGIGAKGENLIYFFSDRVSFRSPSPPPDLLLAATAVGDFPTSSSPAGNHKFRAGGNPAGNQQHTRRHARPSSGSLPSTRRRVSAYSPEVHPEPSLSTFWPILPLPPSVSRLLYGLGPLFLHLQFHSRDFKFHSCDFKLHNRDSPSY